MLARTSTHPSQNLHAIITIILRGRNWKLPGASIFECFAKIVGHRKRVRCPELGVFMDSK